VIRKKKNMPHS